MDDPVLLQFAALIVGGSALLLTLVNTNAAILLLIVSMMFSPEIPLAGLPGRAVVVRFDDLLLLIVFFTWLGKQAMNKQLRLIRSTPFNRPIGAFIVVCIVSTALGIMNGSVANPVKGFFYLLKYVEYFLLFILVANVAHDRTQLKMFFRVMCLTALAVGIFGYWQLLSHGIGFRITAPFEGHHGEPNTLAGYLVIIIMMVVGAALYAESQHKRFVYLAFVAVLLPPFLFTYSRTGYVGLIVSYVAICLLSRRHRPVLFALLLLGVLLAPLVIPSSVFERVASTFDPRGVVRIGAVEGIGGTGLSQSAAFRVLVWRRITQQWMEHPFLGFGVTGIGFVDSQYALILGEVGLVGALIFLWLQWRMLSVTYRIFKQVADPWSKGMSLGFLCGLVGLLVMSLAANIFIIVRIMEPFWFLAALVTALPHLEEDSPARARGPAAPQNLSGRATLLAKPDGIIRSVP